MLQNILLIVSGVLAGGIAALAVIAPRTKNTTDDAVLTKLEALEALVQKLLPPA